MLRISVALAAMACSNPKNEPALPLSDAPMLSDENNFSYTASIDIASKSLPSGEDSFISWETISTDMLGHAYDPDSVTRATLVVFGGMTKLDLETSIAANSLDQSNVRLLLTCTPEELGCWLSDFTMLGTDVDVEERFQPEEGLWLIALSTDGSESQYSKLMLIEPDPNATSNQIAFDDGDSLFEVQADLVSSDPVIVPAGSSVFFDWSELTADGLGNALALHRIDRIDIARYDQLSLLELERRFLDIDLLANARFSANVEGVQGVSTDLIDGFDGFTQNAHWVLALRCLSCGTPMPLFLTTITAR